MGQPWLGRAGRRFALVGVALPQEPFRPQPCAARAVSIGHAEQWGGADSAAQWMDKGWKEGYWGMQYVEWVPHHKIRFPKQESMGLATQEANKKEIGVKCP